MITLLLLNEFLFLCTEAKFSIVRFKFFHLIADTNFIINIADNKIADKICKEIAGQNIELCTIAPVELECGGSNNPQTRSYRQSIIAKYFYHFL